MLTLGWSDGNSFVPVNHCLLSAAQDENLICTAKRFDGRSIAGKRRRQSRRKATDVMLELIASAQKRWQKPSGKDRVRPKQEQSEGLAGSGQYRYGAIGRREHPRLWKTLGHRNIFQVMQILPEAGKRMPEYLL